MLKLNSLSNECRNLVRDSETWRDNRVPNFEIARKSKSNPENGTKMKQKQNNYIVLCVSLYWYILYYYISNACSTIFIPIYNPTTIPVDTQPSPQTQTQTPTHTNVYCIQLSFQSIFLWHLDPFWTDRTKCRKLRIILNFPDRSEHHSFYLLCARII